MRWHDRSRRGYTALGLCLGVWLAPSVARAQVNVEPLRSKLQDDRVGALIDVKLVGRAGNTEGLTAGGSTLLGGRLEPHFAFVSASADYSKLGGAVQVEQYGAHARYNYTLLPKLWWELFAQVEHDQFRLLTFRGLAGTGPRIGLLTTEEFRIFVGTAYMLEYEHLNLPETSVEDPETRAHRSSSYLAMVIRPDDGIVLANTTFFQPRFDSPADYRLLSITSVEFAIRKMLAATISATVRYDSRPPEEVDELDFSLVNSFGLRF